MCVHPLCLTDLHDDVYKLKAHGSDMQDYNTSQA